MPIVARTFTDRAQAGRLLADRLVDLGFNGDSVVVGLPRGGVVTAAEVAAVLHSRLEVLVVRKLGVPWQPEPAMGALAEDGTLVVNREVLDAMGTGPEDLAEIVSRERARAQAQAHRWRCGRPPAPLAGRAVVLVDDGVATGATATAACWSVRDAGAARVVMAVPVGPPDITERLAGVADEVVCLARSTGFSSVSEHYQAFPQASDNAVTDLLQAACW
jgi:predicted phosphoribosyltransferase